MMARGDFPYDGADNPLAALQHHVAELEERLREAEETLDAIRNGEVDAVVVGVADTQRVYTLETADRPYRVLIEQMQEGAVTLSADGTILYCNRCFASMMHEQLERLLGGDFRRFISPQEHTAFESLLAGSAQGGARGEFMLSPSSAPPVPVQLSFVDLPGGTSEAGIRILCGVITDLTERRKLEDQLRHVQKMEAIGQLTGSVAHDFNNLLMAVMGNLDLLRKRFATEARAMKLIDNAMAGVTRGASLTQRLLAFGRRQTLQTEPVDLVGLVMNMKQLVAQSIGPLVEMRFALVEGLPPAQVDRNQLELALLNLAVNARDAMADGGLLTIALDQASVAADDDDGLEPGRYLRLCVSDTGKGMDAQTLEHAVEPFFSTKELGKGTGLGLSMVHGLADQLGGALRLSSAPGQGTTATMWLPIAATPIAAVERPVVSTSETRPSTILLVDDDALIALSTAEMLRDLGHTVLEANSGRKALELLGKGPAIDMMITDQAMPGMTGSELAGTVRGLLPDLPILLATGYGDLPGKNALILPRLSKPYRQADLAAAIAALLGA